MHVGHARMLALSGAFHRARKALSAEGRRAAWHAIDAVKANQETPIARAYADVLRIQSESVLRAWAQKGASLVPPETKADDRDVMVGGLLFDGRRWARAITDDFGPLVAAILEEAFAAGAMRVGRRDLRYRLTDRASEELARVVGLIGDTSTTTQAGIGRIIREGMENGRSVDEIAGRLRATFQEWTGWRARLIAQTTVTATFGAGQQEAFLAADVTHNEWLSQRDDRVRPEHDAMDGEVVEIGRAFSNGLTHPSEPNCRCDLLPVLRDSKAQGRPWRRERDARMRAHYQAVKGKHARWEFAIDDVRENVEGAQHLSHERVRRICHANDGGQG